MAEFLVEKLSNALIDAAFKKLQEEFKLVTGVKDEVKNLSSKFKIIRKMLQDAQRRRFKEEAVGIWLEKVEDIAYDVDDVLDEWNTEVQKLKLNATDNDPNSSLSPSPQQLKSKSWNKVCSLLLSICSCRKQVGIAHKMKEVSGRRDIALKIKELNDRMNIVFQEADAFKFDLKIFNSAPQEFKRIITTSIFDESEVCGRESDKDIILSKILPADSTTKPYDGIRIVSIVGTGGIGKTTLAQLVYHDNRVKHHFQIRGWVCVSDPFDEKRIAKAILEDLEKSSPNLSELETLVKRIKEAISGKKFLLVLDDVWTENYTKWKPIRDSLKDGAPGSRILVTTRSERVARMMGTNYLHPLNQLRDRDCWKILSQIAFQGRPENEHDKFVGIGMEISKKCKGLPLAANFLGSLLQSKDTVEQWENVLKSEMWELEEGTTSLFPHIYLSYNELSPEMKQCFQHCAIFPKDSVFDVPVLIRQWMAQGYLSSGSERAGDLESRGYEYFSNLAMRSFFQNLERSHPLFEGRIMSCKMHDIVHDFAQYIVDGEYLIIENLDEARKVSYEKVRHLTWSYNDDATAIVPNVGKLRSLFYREGVNVTLNLFDCLKCVRVLRLSNTKLEEVPGAIGNLIHLRFLDLSWNLLKVLPEEICELYNLETLDVSSCRKLTQFPERIGNLLNLRHLLTDGTEIEKFPKGLEKLILLRTLSGVFNIGDGYNKFEELRNLNQLGGHLIIWFYEVNEVDFDAATLGNKTHIQILSLVFSGEKTNYATLTESLQMPPNLAFLRMCGYPNSRLPGWIMSLNNVKRLIIEHSFDVGSLKTLPALGKLASLEELVLVQLFGVEILSREFLGINEIPAVRVPFPKLKKLELSGLSNLRIWEDLRREDENVVSAAMPLLEELNIESCEKLEMLPHKLLRKATLLKLIKVSDCKLLQERYMDTKNNHQIVPIQFVPLGQMHNF